jgi:asparagine synthase (glutamine-hydrolysing)
LKDVVEIKLNNSRWQRTHHDDYICYHVHDNINHQSIYHQLNQLANGDAALKQILQTLRGNFACIIDTKDYIFACVDRIRSHSIYFYHQQNNFLIADNPQTILDATKTLKINDNNLLTFLMTGYVLGDGTLYEDLKQLRAGEYLLWNKNRSQLTVTQYYQYLPCPDNQKTETDLLAEHDEIMNRITQRMIARANGKPIWVALSGGFDSRLVLAKLKQFNYNNLHAFSYGVAHNFEAKTAKRVAEQLGVKWLFLPAKTANARRLFASELRKAYTDYAWGCSAVPSYLDFEGIYHLTQNKHVDDSCMIVNGQTGDYLSGGHIPPRLYQNPSEQLLVTAIIDKHASLWEQLKTENNLNLIREKILATKPAAESLLNSTDYYCAWHENWEWQERQPKAVINGQRVYEYFNLDWMLPLWDNELLDFWRTVPIEHKIKQRLFVKYLTQYNYKNVFSRLRDPANIWVPKYRWIPWCAGLIRLCGGRNRKNRYYKRMYYYSTDNGQYAFLGRKYYLQNYKYARNFVSLATLHLTEEFKITTS